MEYHFYQTGRSTVFPVDRDFFELAGHVPLEGVALVHHGWAHGWNTAIEAGCLEKRGGAGEGESLRGAGVLEEALSELAVLGLLHQQAADAHAHRSRSRSVPCRQCISCKS